MNDKPRYTAVEIEVENTPWFAVIDGTTGEQVYRLPATFKLRVQNKAAELNAAAAQPAAAMKPGWSKAARRRAGHTGRSHPLGEAVEYGDGYAVYEDTTFGAGRVQIWDES